MKLPLFWLLPLCFLIQKGADAFWLECETPEPYLTRLKKCAHILPCGLEGGEGDFYFSYQRYFQIFEEGPYLKIKKKRHEESVLKLHFYTAHIANAINYPEASQKQLELANRAYSDWRRWRERDWWRERDYLSQVFGGPENLTLDQDLTWLDRRQEQEEPEENHKEIGLMRLSQHQEEEALFHLRLAVGRDPSVWGILTRMAFEGPQSLRSWFETFLQKFKTAYPDLEQDAKRMKEAKCSVEAFQEKAIGGSPFHAYELAERLTCLKGEDLEEWLKTFEDAKKWYAFSEKCDVQGARGKVQWLQKEKIDPLEKAKGYILNKLIHISSFDPTHPLFKESSRFMDALYPFSPAVVDLGAYILREVLATPSEEETKKKIFNQLVELVKSEDFQETLKKQSVFGVLEGLLKKGGEKAPSELKAFLTTLEQEKQKGEPYILAKIKEGVGEQVFSPDHPLYKGIMDVIGELEKYPPGVKEASIYLFQQLLHFPGQSKQAQAILDHIGQRMSSQDFKNEASAEDPDAENLAEEAFKKIAEQIHITLDQKKLCLPSETPPIQELKIKEAMVCDPRIALYNYFFEEDHKPFDPTAFVDAVDNLVSRFEQYVQEGKITQDMLHDDESDHSIAGEQSLRDFLTNRQEYSNRFAHRIIKIRVIFDTLEADDQAKQLASWAIAGLHCRGRSDKETLQFYDQHTYGSHLAGEDDTLEMRIALILAKYREELLEKIVPHGIEERIHLMPYLKQKAGEDLGLHGDTQGFVDDHEAYAAQIPEQKRYRNMVEPDATTLKNIFLKGNANEEIKPGEGYLNIDKMIDFVAGHINEGDGDIYPQLQQRFERDYGANPIEQLETYYSAEDGRITQEGVRALLYSLGYLE